MAAVPERTAERPRPPTDPGTGRGAAPPVHVREARPDDLPLIADLHTQHLPHGLFPRLGPVFMQSWHDTFVASPYGVSLVAVDDDGEPVGFVVGSTEQATHVAHVLSRHRWRLVARGASALLVRPAVAVHFVRTRGGAYARRLLRPARVREAGQRRPGRSTRSPAVLTALVVRPAARGEGAGAALVDGFLARAGAAGAHRAELVTLTGQEGARGFYEGLGWSHVGEHRTRDGAGVHQLGIDLPSGVGEGRGGGPLG